MAGRIIGPRIDIEASLNTRRADSAHSRALLVGLPLGCVQSIAASVVRKDIEKGEGTYLGQQMTYVELYL